MAGQTAVVSDSFACYGGFAANVAVRSGTTIVPNKLTINGKTYREEVDLSADEALKLLSHQPYAPVITPPSSADYLHVFGSVLQQANAIISVHASRELSQSWANARAAAQQLNHPNIAIVDSRSLSAGQAMLVKTAAEMASDGVSFDETIRFVRSAVENIYSIFYLETMDYLFHNRIIEPAHVILGGMAGIKPILSIENGRLTAIEKVKTRLQAVERLVEYAVEFTEVKAAVILQPKPYLTETGRLLQDRLAAEFPERIFESAIYGGSLAALLGTDAVGLVIYEKEMDGLNDNF